MLLLIVAGGSALAWSYRAPGTSPTAIAAFDGDPLSFFGFAGSLPMLVNGGSGFPTPDLIVQGWVTGAQAYQVAAPSLPPKPGVNLPTQESRVAFTIEISDIVVASAPISPGAITITMRGTLDDPGAVENMGFPLLEVGEEYLLFLVRQPDGTYQTNGGPQGYLRVRGGKAELVARAPVLDQLAGQDVAEVKRQIKGAKQK